MAQEIADNLRMGAKDQTAHDLSTKEYNEIKVPQSKATISLTGAQTEQARAGAEENRSTALLRRTEAGNKILERDPTSPLSPGFQAANDPKEQRRKERGAQLASEAVAVIQELRRHPGFKSAVGAPSPGKLFGLAPKGVEGTDAAGFIQQLERLQSLLTVENFELMRGLGQMTEREFEAMRSIGSSLSTRIREPQFLKELDRLEAGLRGFAAKPATGTQQPTGGRVDSLLNKYGF
jgi:hypothetical protein